MERDDKTGAVIGDDFTGSIRFAKEAAKGCGQIMEALADQAGVGDAPREALEVVGGELMTASSKLRLALDAGEVCPVHERRVVEAAQILSVASEILDSAGGELSGLALEWMAQQVGRAADYLHGLHESALE